MIKTKITIHKRYTALLLSGFLFFLQGCAMNTGTTFCNEACMEDIANDYLHAYTAHDAALAPISSRVRYTENNIEMPFPDGTWDTVTEHRGPVLILTDPVTGNIGIYTAILQDEITGFLAIRLGIENSSITEIEHIISTARNLSSPPTPIGEIDEYIREPVITEVIPVSERLSREELVAKADGYFQTLQMNDGEIRGTCFHADASRRENGLYFGEIEAGFKTGRYFFNNRVRREHVLVDETLGVVMSRGFIDHKGVLNEYNLTDGTQVNSIFQEPQTWAFLEMFKIKDGCIAAVVADFYQAPYYTTSPWSE